MAESLHKRLYDDPVEGCVLEYLDKDGISNFPYACGKCAVLAWRDEDDVLHHSQGVCENLLIDGIDHDFSE